MRLLDRRRLPFLPSLIARSPGDFRTGADLVLAAKDKVRGRRREDRFAVLSVLLHLSRWRILCDNEVLD